MPACLEATSGQATTRLPLAEALPEVHDPADACTARLVQELEPIGYAHIALEAEPELCVHHEPGQASIRQEVLLVAAELAARRRHTRIPLATGACAQCIQAAAHALQHQAGVESATFLAQANEIRVEHAPTVDPKELRRALPPALASPGPPALVARSGAGPMPMSGSLPMVTGSTRPAETPAPQPSHAHSHAHQHDDHAGHDHGPGGHSHAAGGKGHDGHDHGADGHGSHDHGAELQAMAKTNRRRLVIALIIGTTALLAEIFVGLLANSLALLADAAHAVTDQAAVALALIAVTWGMRAATRGKTFGYRRGEVVAAFVNSLALWAVSAYFIFEAFQRIGDPPIVQGRMVVVMGAITLVANLAAAKVLHQGSGHSINMRAAFLHVLSDALGSAAALVAGLFVEYYGWHIADPILTLFIAALILVFTVRLTRQSLHILMEGAPKHIDPEQVEKALRALPEVKDVHDLHVWSITHGSESLTAHVVLRAPPKDDKAMHDVHELLESRFKLQHLTIQVESPDCPCATRHCGPA